jgi:hypothetical protein
VSAETRTTSSTGGQKGVKIERYDLIPVGPLRALAVHFGKGARKYDDGQWRKGYEWSKTISALMRHLEAFREGLDYDVCSNDPEGCKFVDNDGNPYEPTEPDTCYNHTGSHHLDAVMWHSFVLREFVDTHPEHDDRHSTVLRRQQEAEQADRDMEIVFGVNPRFIHIPAGGDIRPATGLERWEQMWAIPEEPKFGVFEDYDIEAMQQSMQTWADETITLTVQNTPLETLRLAFGLPLHSPARFVVGIEGTEDLKTRD